MSESGQSNDKYRKVLADLENAFQTLQEENQRQQERIKSLAGAIRDLRAMRESDSPDENGLSSDVKQKIIKEKIDSIFRGSSNYGLQERLWLRPCRLKKIPRFVPISERSISSNGVSTRFISFVNFKGGVGKTTLVANVGAAFASGQYDLPNGEKARPLRVLLVDLDFQGTLTDRCVDLNLLVGKIKDRKTAANLFSTSSALSFSQLIFPVVFSENAKIIPSDATLDAKDCEALMRLACELMDTRFYFRFLFHKPETLSEFDVVLFDCPPRMTASTICALAVSDYAFIPTSPDLFDQSPIVRTRAFITRLCKTLNTPCQMGGVILNRTNSEKKLSAKEKNFIARINVLSSETPDGIPILKTHIPKRSGEKDSIIGDLGEPLPGGLRRRPLPFLNDLASEIYARIYQ